jgi:hypothetical protein
MVSRSITGHARPARRGEERSRGQPEATSAALREELANERSGSSAGLVIIERALHAAQTTLREPLAGLLLDLPSPEAHALAPCSTCWRLAQRHAAPPRSHRRPALPRGRGPSTASVPDGGALGFRA